MRRAGAVQRISTFGPGTTGPCAGLGGIGPRSAHGDAFNVDTVNTHSIGSAHAEGNALRESFAL